MGKFFLEQICDDVLEVAPSSMSSGIHRSFMPRLSTLSTSTHVSVTDAPAILQGSKMPVAEFRLIVQAIKAINN